NDVEAQVTQAAFFLGYALFSIPAAALLSRLGAAKSILAALALMVAACLLVPVASAVQTYLLVLFALFVMASGITTLQVAANPLAAALGVPERTHVRLLLAQSFNSLGVVLGVQLGSSVMLSGDIFKNDVVVSTVAERARGLVQVDRAFLIIAAALVALMVVLFLLRRTVDAASPPFQTTQSPFAALRSRWATAGAATIFVYVGAEVAIGSIMILFLHRPDVLGLGYADAGWYLGWIYWFGALVGRFAGTALLTRVRATTLLTIAATCAAAMSAAAFSLSGPAGAYAALSIGLFNSIMFPTIFTLTLERSDAPAAATSGLLCLAIAGGGVLPLVVGAVARSLSYAASFAVPAAAYLAILTFALAARRARVVGDVPAMAH
ncbi:MAG: MFS transporter, partial [Sphingomonadaceae bacterium]|nr:MFS transporter [Sphingomonadaceae bacterium]